MQCQSAAISSSESSKKAARTGASFICTGHWPRHEFDSSARFDSSSVRSDLVPNANTGVLFPPAFNVRAAVPDSRRVPQSSYAPFPSVCPQAFLNAFDFREQPLHRTEPLRVQQSLSLPQDRRAGSLRARHSNHRAKVLPFR